MEVRGWTTMSGAIPKQLLFEQQAAGASDHNTNANACSKKQDTHRRGGAICIARTHKATVITATFTMPSQYVHKELR